jgi:branched-chain amino acid aminotransferase
MKPCAYIWKNGSFIEWNTATTHVLTHALHYGSGVFEGIRAYETPKGPAIFKAADHYRRLLASCSRYYLNCPYSVDELIQITVTIIQKNNLPACYIRPLVYADYGTMGILPKNATYSTMIAVWEWGSYLGDAGLVNGIRCHITDIRKTPSECMPATAKCCANYANSFLAKHQAITAGFDEAILLNNRGRVAEGPGENIFIVKNNEIITPPLSDDILDGITRSSVITIARDMGYSVRESSIVPQDLFDADECFFTGTAAEVTPIAQIDNQPIGNGGRGPVTERLQTAYFSIVKGTSLPYSDWLTHCTVSSCK